MTQVRILVGLLVNTSVNYPREVIGTWKTGRLCCLYASIVSRDDPKYKKQLEIIIDILKQRPFAERNDFHWMLNRDVQVAIYNEEYEQVRALEHVRDYFRTQVLD